MREKHQLSYRYEFHRDELAAIKACNEAHGFAVVKEVLPPEIIESLKKSICEVFEPTLQSSHVFLNPEIIDGLIQSDQLIAETASPKIFTRTMVDFIEKSDAMASLMTYEPYMRIVRALYGEGPVTLNRSAAIYKEPGAGVGGWHTDWEPLEGVYGTNAVLNNTGACSNWFYLTGVNPDNGGLALIPDSHTEDWQGPKGFELTENLRSFHRKDDNLPAYDKFDFEEMLPLYAEAGDLVIFAERTFHGVFPHHGDETRLSCAITFRPGSTGFSPCWQPSESTKRFIASCPPEVQPMVKHYTGHSFSWKSNL
ncbi:phytanoyl-CoA dioxygenase family protein [Paenibacillus eucommiae]|uniref:Ectoine hydroxylase-related dioxygenase (Phytanoyl-CoA dioxygenase family) n=1 Tax=Paenibacillus eucommiae TaxID=1355755 RepID=A0ABS4J359_9BACL|nr:phytanoyl-CoA dioxygenase family protein [Paenibacillus eucommiae]MBP1994277.1 ectoine hydroxylase-related dioxygenase (phytanoyl-CoA dioxygenase family) [Paenibacillus eucommiae]